MMKVKVGELKTHLSSYLRKIEEDGEPVEVCVRERTVAYLTPAQETSDSCDNTLKKQLLDAGIEWNGVGGSSLKNWSIEPEVAGDGRVDLESTDSMRTGRDW